MGSRGVRGSKGVRESEGVMGSKGVALPSVRGRGVRASHNIKRGVCLCVSNRLDGYISGVYEPIFAKFGMWMDPPLAIVIPRSRPGPTRGTVGRGAGAKKTCFLLSTKL